MGEVRRYMFAFFAFGSPVQHCRWRLDTVLSLLEGIFQLEYEVKKQERVWQSNDKCMDVKYLSIYLYMCKERYLPTYLPYMNERVKKKKGMQ